MKFKDLTNDELFAEIEQIKALIAANEKYEQDYELAGELNVISIMFLKQLTDEQKRRGLEEKKDEN